MAETKHAEDLKPLLADVSRPDDSRSANQGTRIRLNIASRSETVTRDAARDQSEFSAVRLWAAEKLPVES